MATTEKKQTTRAAGTRAAKTAGTVKAAPKAARAKASPAAAQAPAQTGPDINLVFQYQGRELSQAGMVEAVMNAWTGGGNDPADVKSLELYVKPEDSAVYYVVNGTESGQFDF